MCVCVLCLSINREKNLVISYEQTFFSTTRDREREREREDRMASLCSRLDQQDALSLWPIWLSLEMLRKSEIGVLQEHGLHLWPSAC